MRTRPIDLKSLPHSGAVLVLRKTEIGSISPVIVDLPIPERAAVRVLPPEHDDIELDGAELAENWCEAVGEDAATLLRKYWPERLKVLLVVDDNESVLRAQDRALGESFDLLTAMTAEAALDYLDKEAVGTVLADYFMPNHNGIWLLEKVQAKYPAVRRLLTSGGEVPNLEAHLASGLVERFFPKSGTPNDVLEYLNESIGKN